ncbi:TerB family tellurite resistance protein [Pseudenhygromyxa sp. WMMC2535]|uniref:TerB family tellurite resistance protein n=1 Tax=Pseudenhygromyxa sp. WMMC2535 TaxID=2712867 RepID=UPI001556F1AB|nr:TerB family tellurite resistance protein [Pseudenhygromyxa sp. WMMC2535]NVB43160.1 TerB family tellurite resistance protein [Pseudenhygromyxa sp. WMMC2535]
MSGPGKSPDLDDEDDREEEEPATPVPEVSYLAAIRVWAAAAWADGKLVPREAAAMRGIVERFPLNDKERALALGWIETPVEFETNEVVNWPYPVRVGVFRAAADMIACDEEIDGDERRFLDRLRDTLRIPEDEAERVLESVSSGS